MQSFIRVVSSEGGLLLVWPLIKAVFHKCGLSFKAVFHKCGLSSDRSFKRVVVYQCTLASSLSSLHQNGLAFIRVVFKRVVFHQRGFTAHIIQRHKDKLNSHLSRLAICLLAPFCQVRSADGDFTETDHVWPSFTAQLMHSFLHR